MTDHKAEAQEWLEYSGNENPDVDGRAMHGASLAQVHATLALVEQQRIANLIALSTYGGSEESMTLIRTDAVYTLMEWMPHGPQDEHLTIRPEIKEALGL